MSFRYGWNFDEYLRMFQSTCKQSIVFFYGKRFFPRLNYSLKWEDNIKMGFKELFCSDVY